MSIKGGYKIIDFKNTAITTGVGVVIKGIYESIENNYGKMTIASGLNIDGIEYPDTPIFFNGGETNVVGGLKTAWTDGATVVATIITVADTDTVTVSTATLTQG